MTIRLQLKDEYEWPSRNPEKPNRNKIGFVQTDAVLPIGKRVIFEDLNATSEGGDLNPKHYKYFKGKEFESVKPPFPHIAVELLEV